MKVSGWGPNQNNTEPHWHSLCGQNTHIFLDDIRVSKWWNLKWWKLKKLQSFNFHLDIILITLNSLAFLNVSQVLDTSLTWNDNSGRPNLSWWCKWRETVPWTLWSWQQWPVSSGELSPPIHHTPPPAWLHAWLCSPADKNKEFHKEIQWHLISPLG